MSTTTFFEDDFYPANDDGRADKSKPQTSLELFRTNYFGDDQIFLRIELQEGHKNTIHLTKQQAKELAETLLNVVSYIGYDNR